MLDAIFSAATLRWLMWILYVPSCVGLIVIVLLQKGKGAGFAGAFGIGPGSEAVFGPRASKSLPVRLTHVMAAIFVLLALGLTIVEGYVTKGKAPDKVDETMAQEPSALTELGLGSAYEEGEEPGEAELETESPVGGTIDVQVTPPDEQPTEGVSGEAEPTQQDDSETEPPTDEEAPAENPT